MIKIMVHVELLPCGHLICSDCFDTLVNMKKDGGASSASASATLVCPFDRQSITKHKCHENNTNKNK